MGFFGFFPPSSSLIYLTRLIATSRRKQSRRIRAPLIRKQRMPAFNKHLSGRWRRSSQRRGGSFRVPWDQRRNGSAGRGLARFSPPGCGAERGVATRAGNPAHLSPPAPCLRTLSAQRRESRRDIHAQLSTGGTQPSPPLLRDSQGSAPLPARPRTLSLPGKGPVLAAGGRRQLRAPPRLSAPGIDAARASRGPRSC